jgi:hypothetical protein
MLQKACDTDARHRKRQHAVVLQAVLRMQPPRRGSHPPWPKLRTLPPRHTEQA